MATNTDVTGAPTVYPAQVACAGLTGSARANCIDNDARLARGSPR
ncbi:MAG TPA: hypothetical protein VHL85_00635 [Burkholderiales bacterium]|nr:hypothetical protein [Burkholderiales bacterium]